MKNVFSFIYFKILNNKMEKEKETHIKNENKENKKSHIIEIVKITENRHFRFK